jgi:hypothetical protein
LIIELTKEEKRRYTQLYVSGSDFTYAGTCAEFLLKKGWHVRPWERRGSIYLQQSVWTTAMVTAYGRPFYKKDWGNNVLELLRYSDEEHVLHKALIDLRNEVYAHSDPRRTEVKPWKSDGFETEIVGVPLLMVSASDCSAIAAIAERAVSVFAQERKDLLTRVRKGA